MNVDTPALHDGQLLTGRQIAHYAEHGWLRIPAVFSPEETRELAEDLDWLLSSWSVRTEWTGGWRQHLMDTAIEAQAKIDSLHDLQLYSGAWARAVATPRLVAAVSDLLGGGPVELHHTTMHVKPPETGMPFPLHQDFPFYEHVDGRYVDVLVHLDDTRHENGEIRFLDGSHKNGALDHIEVEDGQICSPHLPTDRYRLEDTVPVPAQAGDVVCFSIHTVHGSYLNTTAAPRRLVRVGYRHPDNAQLDGQSLGRPGLLVWGQRPHHPGTAPLRQT